MTELSLARSVEVLPIRPYNEEKAELSPKSHDDFLRLGRATIEATIQSDERTTTALAGLAITEFISNNPLGAI